ncbi:MAG: Ig-like domain-containing protein, partial [Gemmatimonadota bacterium]
MFASIWPHDRIACVVSAVLVAGVVLCTGCSWDDLDLPSEDGNGPEVASVAVTPTALGLGGVGDSALMLAEAYDRLGRSLEKRAFQWFVSDSTIASVDAAGLLRALALGNVTVGATTDGVYGTAEVEIDASFAVERACGQCHSNLIGDHVDLGFASVSCWLCHNPAGETHRRFQNNHMTVAGGFQLLGIHTAIQCSGCHVKEGSGLRFTPSDVDDCVACHRSDYDATHGGSSFPTICTSCHTPSTWVGATIEHGAVSGGFDLVGVHAALSCTSCHVAGSYAPLFSPTDENDCIACHQIDYDLKHAGSGYPTSCLSCHDGTVWTGATFDHGIASGGFDLVGQHTSLSCTACHDPVTGQPLFSPVDESDCIACHQSDYDSQHA